MRFFKAAQVPVIMAVCVGVSTPVYALSANRIEMAAGGMMTRGLRISIDLDSGDVLKSEEPYPNRSGMWIDEHRKLTASELTDLKTVAKSSLEAGFESSKCLQEEENWKKTSNSVPHPLTPNADSIVEFHVRLDGQSGDSVVRGCESHAYNVLWTKAFNLASGTHFPVPTSNGS